MARAVRSKRNETATSASAERAALADDTVAELPAPAPSRALQGFIDRATWTCVEGWVWDPATPDERIRLEVVAGDVVLATGIAEHDRPGLAAAGVGDGRHAFAIELEPGLLSAGRHELHLRCAATGAAVPGSPFVLQAAAEPPFRWHLDEINDTEAAGWIIARNEPTRRCTVLLKEGGRVLARAVASRYRKDLQSAGIGDGCHAFSLEMPRALLDGEEHALDVVEEESGLSLMGDQRLWRSAAGTAGSALTGITAELGRSLPAQLMLPARRPAASAGAGARAVAQAGTHLLVDISDLVYYIGHHPNLTGIQRVQSSIVLAMIDGRVIAPAAVTFMSFNARSRDWMVIPTGFLLSLLRDLFLPESQRLISFPAEEARYGMLPGARPFDGTGVLDDGNPSVLCLLGAAWVHQDYVHRVLALKRRFATRFVMTVHDLIPIYARETCDQDTARVFEEFMRRALPHVDHVLTVSENTARDVRRYLAALHVPEPAITVTRNGSSFTEFLHDAQPAAPALRDLPERFVLFVATIEGRKNHQLIYDLWQRMVAEGDDPPHLICVGRLGWKATAFVSALVESDYLGGRVHLLREVSDTDLRLLYQRCLFTVCPTLYEGWGLPVGESLAMGKICVCSDRASIPEVAGECGVYIDIDDAGQCLRFIRELIRDEDARHRLEAKIRRDYVPITWKSVAERVAAACEASLSIQWQEPYPYTSLPCSTEISFGRLDQDVDGPGELLLTRILDARQGHFTDAPLDQQSFLLGEAIRAGGSWAQPERWGTWLCHAGGDVVFSLAADDSRQYYVFLLLRVCGVLHDQPIRLLANNERVWEGKIGPHSRNIVLRLRKRTEPARPWQVRIGAEVDLSPELRSQIAALDGRLPTIGFERMIVVAENDLKTRLDVLTRFVM